MSDERYTKPFQEWLESSQDFLASHPMDEALRQKLQQLFGAWQGFAETVAAAKTSTQPNGPFDPAGWADLAGAGGLGDLFAWFGGAEAAPWAARKRTLELTREWAAYSSALTQYRLIIGAAWFAALKRFAENVTAAGAPSDFRAMQACWQQVADEEMAAAQRSQAFMDAQRDLIRARLDCAAILKAQITELAELIDLPTRAEVDALHRELRELRDELRQMRGGV